MGVGEETNIFPYQENEKLFFNSAMVDERPILHIYARPLLAEAITPGADEDPNEEGTQEVSDEATRLLGLLDSFYPLDSSIVPAKSCIRETVGGSASDY